jgi:hypothetical protein
MSILSICSISSMTRFAAAVSSSRIISSKTVGTICHETPNLSFSQPQGVFSTCRKLLPQLVDLCLTLAIDQQRDGLVELELRPPIQRRELLTLELEGHGQHRPRQGAVLLPGSARR